MTSKERVLTSFNHQCPDKVPVDFGAMSVTGIHVSCVAALRDYYGLEKRPVKVHEAGQLLGWIDEDLKQAMGIDVEGVFPRKSKFGFPMENWKPWTTFQGLEVMVPGDFNTSLDANGDLLIYPEGDLTVAPSGRMPRGGYFFDMEIRQSPIEDSELDPCENLEEFGLISEEDLLHLKKEVQRASRTGRAICASFGGMSLGDVAQIPGPSLKNPKGIRDVAEWYISIRARQDYIRQVFSKQCEITLANLEKIHSVIGDAVDVVSICGTDFGTQTSSFCSVDTFRQLYMPYYQKINGWIHQNTRWKTFKHSCGAVEKFMESFIESGFDIINPVQCSAAGMEPGKLKSKYGERLVFWGGGVDTQQVLPFGTPEEIRRQVLERCEIFSRGGGFVFNSVHNIQAETPVRNIVAMLDAIREFNNGR
jgi:hypothetical protein